MGHPEIENTTPFAFELSLALDEEGRPLALPLVQATYEITPLGELRLAEEQEPPSLTGELWGGDSATASYRIEPAFAFTKLATDVMLAGHAQSARPVTELMVTFRVGPVGKVLRVVGDRMWARALGAISPTRPQPFDRMPIAYERAFGGWDRSHPDPARHTFEPRNPVGTGFRGPDGVFEEGIRLPNVEDPGDPVETFGQRVVPAGVGPISPNWEPRAERGGTFDEAWTKERMPLLPKDFDRRFFNAASPGLVAPGLLRGDEPVLVENAWSRPRLSFRLPGGKPPGCRFALRSRENVDVALALDTVVVDTDKDRVLLLYRGHAPVREGLHDVRAVAVHQGDLAVRAGVSAGGGGPAWLR